MAMLYRHSVGKAEGYLLLIVYAPPRALVSRVLAVGRQRSAAEVGHVGCVAGIGWLSFGRWSLGICR